MYSNIVLILGHLVGDYLFQGEEMAVKKSEPGNFGILWCLWHCFIYSTCVSLFVMLGGFWSTNIIGGFAIVFGIAFLSHYWIDRYSLGWVWMKFIGQSRFKDVDGNVSDKVTYDGWGDFSKSDDVIIDKRQYFIAPIYIAVDNTLHLILMWIGLSLVEYLAH